MVTFVTACMHSGSLHSCYSTHYDCCPNLVAYRMQISAMDPDGFA